MAISWYNVQIFDAIPGDCRAPLGFAIFTGLTRPDERKYLTVEDGVPDIPSAARRQFGIRENLPTEVKFSRRVVGDADPYGFVLS